MRAIRRFGRSVRLNLRPVVGKNPLLFLLILAQMTLLFWSVDQSLSYALQNYDYVSTYFEQTGQPMAALVLNNQYIHLQDQPGTSEDIWQEIAQAGGRTPLGVQGGGTLTSDDEDATDVYFYSPDLLAVERPVQAGRWLNAGDGQTGGCVVSAELAARYPVGSTLSYEIGVQDKEAGGGWRMETLTYQVVGVLAAGEVPMNTGGVDGTGSMSMMLFLQNDRPFVIIPQEDNLPFAGLTMWFSLGDCPAEELGRRLAGYGEVYTPEQLVENYRRDALESVFLESPRMLLLLLFSLLMVVSVMVMSFGGNRRYWSVLYLLGQSQHSLTGSVCAIYALTVCLALALSRLALWWGGSVSISVARRSVSGLVLLSIVCISFVVVAFFRHSPMKLFYDNR